MTAPILSGHIAAARRRVVLDTVAIGLPAALALTVLVWRLFGLTAAVVAAVAGLAAIAWIAARRARAFDRAWLVAALDAQAPDLEDSSALLFADASALTGLAALQRRRVEARAQVSGVDLRPAWSRRLIAWSLGGAVVVILAAVLWPHGRTETALGPDGRPVRTAPGAPKVGRSRLKITPPAYTGLPVVEQSALDARIVEGSRVEWTVDIAPKTASAALDFPGETRLALSPVDALFTDGRWKGQRVFQRSALYRIDAPGLARQRLHRLETIPDAAPVVRTVSPETQLVMTTPGQSRWTPVFEASDDYGVAASAVLRITVTKGEGENITTTERTMVLTSQGEARRKRFAPTLDLAREGLVQGGDMIVQLVVSDNRAPARQTVEGPSVILRWPTAQALAEGLDGMVKQVMPAYFRSQRQIIIDAEALIAQRARITPDTFIDRSNGLGADQAQLRLRYGQFMGEEAEGGGHAAPTGGLSLPTNDGPGLDLPTNDAPAAPEPAHHDDDGHDHGRPDGAPSSFGDMGDVVAQFGHAHDTGDASTLFDPGTRSTLARALDAMWDSERALRQGKPQDALPHAHRALELLKTAQQAGRIFLARAPPKLPPIDLTRRLSGKREGIVADRLAPTVRTPVDTPAVEAWRALGEPSAPLKLDALATWVRANQGRLADPLALSAAIDTVRNEPDCRDCRVKLRALLWTALDRPPAAVDRRAPADARGRRYLDALR